MASEQAIRGENAEKEDPKASAGDYTDYAAAITKQTSDMMGSGDKDSAMDKAKETETKDTAFQKAGDNTGRMAELKEAAAVAARRAMDMFTGRAAEIDPKALEGGDINEVKFGESEYVAREKMGEMKINEEGVYDEAKQKGAAEWETAAERGIAARKNIYGAMGSVKEAIKDKLTYPTDIVQEARASREYGGSKTAQPERGEKLVDDVEPGPSGPGAMPTVFTSD